MTSERETLSAYFDADLQPDEYSRLRAWLHENTNHVADFLVDGFVHTQLIDLLGPDQASANALVTARLVAKSAPPSRTRRAVRRVLAVAVLLAFVVATTYFVAARPEYVATVTGTRNVQWAMGVEKRTVGDLLQAGDELALDRGTLHLTFVGGAQVALGGPARFRVESDYAGRLIRGSLSAFVLEHAVGFTIHSGQLNVVDLGTEFRIDQGNAESCELQVFDGLVEVWIEEPVDPSDDGKLKVSGGQAIGFDAAAGKIKPIEFNKTMRLPASAWSR
jgi:ferric-dicitrate binding protein FerR (iron transport regulator)